METPIFTIDSDDTVEERLTDNAEKNILPARYLLKNEAGEITETPSDLFERVASNVAAAEDNFPEGPPKERVESDFEAAMKELRFMPNSPTLMNAGTPMNQLSACFVLEPRDNMRDIKETDTDAAMIFKSGGGVGYAFHHLRPKGSYISTTGGHSSGPVSMMQMYDETCQQVKQGGKRRGAQMGIMRVDHPDIGRFILAKRNEGNLDNFNISVGVTQKFIEAVKNGDTLTFGDPKTDYDEEFDLIPQTKQFYDPQYQDNPKSALDEGEGEVVDENLWRDYADSIDVRVDGETVSLREKWEDKFTPTEREIETSHRGQKIVEKTVEEPEYPLYLDRPLELPAEFLWDMMVDGAHRNGEPGIFHYDETNEENTFPRGETEYDIEATNPCAEQPLSEYEACNLGHVNLSLMLQEDAPVWTDYSGTKAEYLYDALDMATLTETVQTGTRFLDNVVTQSDFPLDEVSERVGNLRKIGVGIMGLAQMLYQMGIPYDSELGRDIAAEVMKIVDNIATRYSHDLAEERGSFPAWSESKYADPMEHSDWFRRHTYCDPQEFADGYPIRNHKVTTVAPTGTTSMLGDTSGGCEPVYSVAFYKNVGDDIQGDDMLVEFDSYFLKALRANDIDVETVKREAEEKMEADEWNGVDCLNTVPDEFGDVFVTTEDIAPEDHTLMQRRLQDHIDSGISKTINLPAEATRDDVDDAYRLALSDDAPGRPAKGMTVYRDKSRDEQVKATSKEMASNDISDIEGKLVDLYHSDEISDEAVTELVHGAGLGIEEDIDGEICPECQDSVMQNQEGCALCAECGYSPCA